MASNYSKQTLKSLTKHCADVTEIVCKKFSVPLLLLLAISCYCYYPAASLATENDESYRKNQMLKDLSENKESMLKFLYKLSEESDPEFSIQMLINALRYFPDDTQILYLLGSTQLKASHFADAAKTYTRLTELQPDNPAAYKGLSSAFIKSKNFKAAVRPLKKLLKLQPENEFTYKKLASTLARLKNYKEAIKTLKDAQQQFPNNADTYTHIIAMMKNPKEFEKFKSNIFDNILKQTKSFEEIQYLKEANDYSSNGNYSKAADILAKGVKDFPDSPLLHFNYAQALVGLNALDNAIEHIKKTTELAPDFLEAKIMLVSLLGANNRAEEGIVIIEEILQSGHSSSLLYKTYGALLANKGRYKEAIAVTEKAVKLQPDDYTLHMMLAECYKITSNFSGAVVNLIKAAELHPANAEEYLGFAEKASDRETEARCLSVYVRDFLNELAEKDLKNAEQIITSLQKKADSADAQLYNHILSELAAGDLPSAIPLLEKAAELTPNNPDVLRILAAAQIKQKDFFDAVNTYRLITRLEPDNARLHLNFGMLSYLCIGLDKCLETLHHALELDPKLSRAYATIGLTLRLQELPQEAIPALKKYYELEPDNYKAAYSLARMQQEANNIPEAIAGYKEMITINPEINWPYWNLFRLYTDTGEYQQAIEILQDAAKICPERATLYNWIIKRVQAAIGTETPTDAIKNAEEYLSISKEFIRSGKRDESIEALLKGAAIYPDNTKIHYTLGVICAAFDCSEKALAPLKRYIELHPYDAQILNQYGEILLFHTKQYEEAIEVYKSLIKNHPQSVDFYDYLATAYRYMNNYADAIKVWEDAAHIFPDKAEEEIKSLKNLRDTYNPAISAKINKIMNKSQAYEEYLQQGIKCFKDEKFSEAVILFEKALPGHPQTGAVYSLYGVSLFSIDRLAEATTALLRSIELDPDLSESYYYLSLSLFFQDNFEEAIPIFKQVIDKGYDSDDIYAKYGMSLLLNNRFTESAAAFRHLTESDPSNPNNFALLGTSLFLDKKQAESLPFFAKATEMGVLDKVAKYYGRALFITDNFARAIPVLQRQIELKKDLFMGYYMLGVSLDNTQKYPEAIAAFKQAVAHTPDQNDKDEILTIIKNIRNRMGNKPVAAQTFSSNDNSYTEALKEYLGEKDKQSDIDLSNKETLLCKSLARSPDNIDLCYQLADILIKKKEFIKALHYIRKTVAAEPDRTEAYIALGYALTNSNHLAKALPVYEVLIERLPNDAALWWHYGLILSDINQHDASITALRKAQSLNKNNICLNKALGIELLNYKGAKFALPVLERCIELAPDDYLSVFNLAKAKFELNDIPAAVSGFIRAIEISPIEEDAYDMLADSLINAAEPQHAVAILYKAKELFPENAEYYTKKISTLESSIAIEASLNEPTLSPTESNTLNTDDVQELINYGCKMLDTGNPKDGISALKKAATLSPDSTDIQLLYGNALGTIKNYPEAAVAFKRAVELTPESADAQSGLGTTLYYLGNFEEALKPLRKTTQLIPNDVNAHIRYGAALSKCNNHLEAIAAYRKALKLAPDHPGTIYNLGFALQKTGDITEAIQMYNKALQLAPDYTEAHYQLSRALADSGDMYSAALVARGATKAATKDAKAFYQLGYTLFQTGKYNEAIEVLTTAQKLGTEETGIYNLLSASYIYTDQFTQAEKELLKAYELKLNYAASSLACLYSMWHSSPFDIIYKPEDCLEKSRKYFNIAFENGSLAKISAEKIEHDPIFKNVSDKPWFTEIIQKLKNNENVLLNY